MKYFNFPCEEICSNNEEKTIKLKLPPISDDDLPSISIVTITYNRPEFVKLMIRNYESINYPKEKMEWIVVDDTSYGPGDIKYTNELKTYGARVVQLDNKLTIGKKRNFINCLTKNKYIVHMDDDDYYYSYSVVARIRTLLAYEKIKNTDESCVGCNKVNCFDLITCESFEAFDKQIETVSESTMAYSRKFWETHKYDNNKMEAECIEFVGDSEVCIIPSSFVITQFTHHSNTIQRRLTSSPNMRYDFLNNISKNDTDIIEHIRSVIIIKIPEYKEPIEFVKKVYSNLSDMSKVRDLFADLEYNASIETLCNSIVLETRRNYLHNKNQKRDNRTIVYYCGPGRVLRHSNTWNPESKTLGGSEEAVINLTKEFVKLGYRVIVYCLLEKSNEPTVLSKESQLFDGVLYKPYWLWNPLDYVDTVIVWRDPTIANITTISCKNLILDMHDALDVYNPNDFKKIFVKSEYHKKYIHNSKDVTNIVVCPNGIEVDRYNHDNKDNNMAFCSSSPDRCLSGLLKVLPIIRQKHPNFKIYWAYGFNAGVNKGGIAEDTRPEVKSYYNKCLNDMNIEGFINLNRLSQEEIIEYYKKSKYLIYGTRFPEIDCISFTKAICAGCVPLVVGPAALREKMQLLNIDIPDVNDTASLDKALVDGPEFDYWLDMIINTIDDDSTNTNDTTYDFFIKNYDIKNVTKIWIKEIQ